MVSTPARLLVAVIAIVAMWATPAFAAPGDPTTPPNEGDNLTLAEALEQANAAWLQAQTALEASQKRQADLAAQMDALQRELGPIEAQVNTIAAARKAIDAEVANQQEQAAIMAKKKDDTEKALALAGGKATGGFVSVNSPVAAPAQRNTDGSWPKDSCIVDDPTTTGCITRRTLHAMNEAKKAGFTRFVSCYRPSGPYEHPKGRACDFAAQANGFGGTAAGGDKIYGSNLAAFFVRNANSLAVLYVIWFKQIWTPSAGWHSYSGVCGDPSCDHTNHVHLSVI